MKDDIKDIEKRLEKAGLFKKLSCGYNSDGSWSHAKPCTCEKKPKSMLEEQIEKDIGFSLELGLAHSPLVPYYLSVAMNHAQHIEKERNGQLRRKEAWKQTNEVIQKCEWYKGCDKRPTKIVSHEVERFYGKKHIERCYCTLHAKAEVKNLKKGDQRIGVKFSYEPILVREI